MANEIKNRQHAIGTFVGVEPIVAPFTQRIVNAVGVDAFTRNSPGNYTAVLRDAIGLAGATVRADVPANFLGIAGAQIAANGGTVLITVFDLSGVPADPPLISFEVVSVVEGEGPGPAPVLPGPPPPPPPAAASRLLGWVVVNLNGDIQEESVPPLVDGAVGHPATGNYEYTLVAGTPVAAAAISADGSLPTDVTSQVGGVGPLSVSVRTFNGSGAAANRGHSLFFYST